MHIHIYNLLSTAALGILIGILVSAPMGPVGALCVRRTLHKGQKAGLLTGIGAAVSDIIYASISYMGGGLISSLVEKHEVVLTIFGSLLIMIFGLYLYICPPEFDVPVNVKGANREDGLWQMTVSGFALAFSNPLVVLFLIAFYSRFNFIPSDIKEPILYAVWSLFFIAVGAMLWWFGITTFIAKFREKSSYRGISIFNRVIAVLFMLVAVVGLVRATWAFLF